jgi:hypothetical protein
MPRRVSPGLSASCAHVRLVSVCAAFRARSARPGVLPELVPASHYNRGAFVPSDHEEGMVR